MFQAQRLEFALYALAAHCSHLPEAKQDRRFRDLTPADFLSQAPEKRALRKATLGQIATLFGDRFMLPASEVEDLVDRRNLIVHGFYRQVEWRGGTETMADPKRFLAQFAADCSTMLHAIRGLLDHLVEASAAKEGRPEAYVPPSDSDAVRAAFAAMVERHLAEATS